jgi:predicted nucleic acid-binding protein
MNVFVDTSALLAVLDADDQNHASAKMSWESLISNGTDLVCTNYVLVETFALVQNRLGIEAVRTLQEDIVPLLQIEWIDPQSHNRGVAALLTAARRQLSLVDCASFDTMRRLGITTAFAFDRHFAEQGFSHIP